MLGYLTRFAWVCVCVLRVELSTEAFPFEGEEALVGGVAGWDMGLFCLGVAVSSAVSAWRPGVAIGHYRPFRGGPGNRVEEFYGQGLEVEVCGQDTQPKHWLSLDEVVDFVVAMDHRLVGAQLTVESSDAVRCPGGRVRNDPWLPIWPEGVGSGEVSRVGGGWEISLQGFNTGRSS